MDSVSACLFSSLSFMFLPQYFLCFILVCILFDFSFSLFNSVFNYLTTDFLFCHISVDSVIRVSSLTSGSLGWIIAPFATALGSLLGSAVSHLESSGMNHSLILFSWITHGGPAGQRVWAHVNPNKTTWAGRNAESWGPSGIFLFLFFFTLHSQLWAEEFFYCGGSRWLPPIETVAACITQSFTERREAL